LNSEAKTVKKTKGQTCGRRMWGRSLKGEESSDPGQEAPSARETPGGGEGRTRRKNWGKVTQGKKSQRAPKRP